MHFWSERSSSRRARGYGGPLRFVKIALILPIIKTIVGGTMAGSSPTTLIVHFDIVETRLVEFLQIIQAHGENSLQIEPGCLRFEMLVPQEPQAHVILIEAYTDGIALESHWKSEHMAEFRNRIDGMVVKRTVYRCGDIYS
jgi:(4S)-4-hydroxy-5-phosphonooxypentane-2,3-dione isomerase